ncbi:calmodulin [Drosophila kikkawai]|uniref:Calmodulin n=1 Tax=Drosophila kikkawai TaxID=30033 RepID=A0A6P4IAI3_DROKI|nr:calmodulin [Drosophila kikkawai]
MDEHTTYTLNEDLMTEIREAFALCDPENSGLIDSDDLVFVLQALGYNYTEAEIYLIIEELDEDYIGKIDLRSFVHFMTKKYKVYEKKENLVTAFKVIDRDGLSAITPSKLRAIYATLGEKISDEDLDAVFHEADVDGDGVINLRDFLSAYNS